MAVKYLHPMIGRLPGVRERFAAEAAALAALADPHVVQVITAGVVDGQPYLVMEYCPRGTLAERVAGGPRPVAGAAALVATVARAVGAAHARRIVHRDLKPANILFDAAGRPKVADFGLAKWLDQPGPTAPSEVFGTPAYMAPEQATPKAEVGPGADVYALGAVLYHALTGQPPFNGASAADILIRVTGPDAPIPPRVLRRDVPRDLETVCLKCLEKSPRRRYDTAAALADDLDRFVAGEPVTARPPSAARRAGRWAARHPVVTAAAVLLALGAGVVYAQSVRNARALDRQLDTALDVADVLGDELVATIKPIAATKSRDVLRVLGRAEDSFAKLAAGSPGAKVGRRLAKLQLGLADVYFVMGELDTAADRAADAARRYADLAARQPADPEHRRGAARADFLTARIETQKRNFAAAEQAAARSADGFAALRADAPGDGELETEHWSAVQHRMLLLWNELGRRDEADALAGPLVAARRALADRPGAPVVWLVNYGIAVEKQADFLYDRALAAPPAGRPAAVAACRAKYAEATALLRRAAAREPSSYDPRAHLVAVAASEAELSEAVGDPDESRKQFRKLQPDAKTLSDSNEDNLDAFGLYLRCRDGEANAMGNKTVAAIRHRRDAHAEIREVCRVRMARQPDVPLWRVNYASQSFNYGLAVRDLGDWPAAAAAFNEAASAWEEAYARFPRSLQWPNYVSMASWLVTAHELAGDAAAASAALARGRAFAAARGSPDAGEQIARRADEQTRKYREHVPPKE